MSDEQGDNLSNPACHIEYLPRKDCYSMTTTPCMALLSCELSHDLKSNVLLSDVLSHGLGCIRIENDGTIVSLLNRT
jgi:hypothetical protein